MRASREAYPAKPCTAGTMEHLTDMDALALVTEITVACARAEYLRSLFPLPPGRIERATPGEGLAPCPFCGGSDIDPHYMTDGEIAPIHGDGAMPGCRSCGAIAPNREAWNRRTYSTPMRQQRLEEQAMKADEAEARAGRAMEQNDRVLEQNERLMAKCENLQQQAEIHAQEARTANATIHEIYQLCTGATGEPGNWHGAEPARRLLEQLAKIREELAERNASFELRWNADMRAIQRWREAGGDELAWPDHADLCVWLMEQLENAKYRKVLFESAVSGLKYESPAAAGTISAIIVNESRWEEFVQRIPTSIRELPKAWLGNAAAKDDGDFISDLKRGEADQQRRDAETLEFAIAREEGHAD